MAGRYSKNGLPNLDVYLKGDSASDIRVDRRGRPSEFVSAPALTFGLAVQPDVIRGLAGRPGFRGRGLLARFLFSWPREMVGRRKVGSVSVSPGADGAYCDRFRRLLAGAESVKEEPNHAPVLITLGGNAKRLLDEFERELEPQLGEHGPLGHLQDWGSKATGKVARIAGLLHIAEAGSIEAAARSPMGVNALSAATTIGRYLIEHAKIAFAEMGADPEQGQARLILGWLETRGLRRFTKREAFNGMRSRFRRASELDAPLRLLSELGYLQPLPQEGEAGPGRPASQAFGVNPHVHAHKSQNPRNPGSADYAYSAT
jgi:hypothetical protein